MTVLCYHAVEPCWTAPMSIEPAAFARHAEWLARHRAVVPLRQVLDRLDRRGRLPGRRVALTFDDGFESVQEHALPVLRRLGLPATVFLVAKTLDGSGAAVDWVDHPPAYPLSTLTREQVREMQRAGVEFESHSYAHADLTGLGHEASVRDLRDSRELLGDLLGRRVTLLAYPRGRHDDQVRAAARKAGYTHAFALPEGPEEPGRYAVPRVGIYHDNTVGHLRLKVAGPYLAARSAAVAAKRRLARR